MSLKDNKNGPVIHALSNAMGSSKNPLIIPIECNINGRGEGLKFNIYDIASFVNSNYHLNRNNMKLRQLYETEDVPNLISAENHVLGKNAASNLVNELAVPGKTVNEASDERSQHPKSKSQQPQKNAVDKGKNIMDNRNASTKHPISNNYKEGEMHGSDQDTKSIEEKLSESGNVRGVSTTTSGQPVNIDDEKKQVSDQPTAQMPLQMESGSEFEVKDDQRDSPSPESSASGGSSSSSFVNVSMSDGGVTDSGNGEYVKFEGIVEDTALKDTGSSQDIQAEASRPLSSASLNVGNVPTTEEPAVVIANIGVSQQLKTLPFDSEPSGMSVEDGTAVPSVDGNKEKQTSPTGDAAQMDDNDDYGLSLLFSEDDNKNSQPVPSVPLVIQGNDAKSASRTPGKNDPVPQKTKGSKWPIVAASVLAIAGVALEVAIAVHLEMLAVGIAVGACCLVAAAVMYHYKWPSSFIENSQIEKVHLMRRKDL